MKVLFLVIAFWMVLAWAKALDIVVTDDISCEDLPVSMSVTWLCNEESLCTCGDEVSVQGKSKSTISKMEKTAITVSGNVLSSST